MTKCRTKIQWFQKKLNWFWNAFFFKSVNQVTKQEQHVVFKDSNYLPSVHAPEKQEQRLRKRRNFHPSVSSAHTRRAVRNARQTPAALGCEQWRRARPNCMETSAGHGSASLQSPTRVVDETTRNSNTARAHRPSAKRTTEGPAEARDAAPQIHLDAGTYSTNSSRCSKQGELKPKPTAKAQTNG